MVDENDVLSRWPDTRLNRLAEKVDALAEKVDAPTDRDHLDDSDSTRTNITRTQRSGETVEFEWDSIHSVEITNTTKDGPRVSKVKLYGPDPTSVAEDAAVLFIEAERHLERYLRIEEAIIQDAAGAPNAEADTSSDPAGGQSDG